MEGKFTCVFLAEISGFCGFNVFVLHAMQLKVLYLTLQTTHTWTTNEKFTNCSCNDVYMLYNTPKWNIVFLAKTCKIYEKQNLLEKPHETTTNACIRTSTQKNALKIYSENENLVELSLYKSIKCIIVKGWNRRNMHNFIVSVEMLGFGISKSSSAKATNAEMLLTLYYCNFLCLK